MSNGPNDSDFWHYARWKATLDGDPDVIDCHARDLLCRALNIGSLVAFVSSGVSMAYGRLSWYGLVCELAQRAMERAEGNSGEDVEIARQTLRALGYSEGGKHDFSTDALTLAFEQCELLWERAKRGSDDDRSIRDIAADLLCDDAGHAETLFKALVTDLKSLGHQDMRRLAPAGEEAPPPAAEFRRPRISGRRTRWNEPVVETWRVAFTSRTLNEILRVLHSDLPADSLELMLTTLVASSFPNGARALLAPKDRFVTLALLRLLDSNQLASLLTDLDKQASDICSNRLPQRGDRFDPALDPLGILTGDLRVRRMLTTNYDRDIERLLEDLNFRREQQAAAPFGAPPPTRGLDPIGQKSRDFVVDGFSAPKLIEFALRDRLGRFEVAHLHGAADHPESMVVTAGDYQRRYYTANGERHPVSEALSLVFDANPVLFVGNGMGEDDILRPLRHFVSDTIPRGRTLIALMPGNKSHRERRTQQLNLMKTYGVYAIYTGRATYRNGEAEAFWLYEVLKLSKRLKKFYKGIGSEQTNEQKKAIVEQASSFRKDQSAKILSTISHIDGTFIIDTALDTNRELDCLRGITNIAADHPSSISPRLALACVAILDGIENALTSICLCASLRRLARDWEGWKQRWYALPPPRSSGGPELAFEAELG